MKADSSSSYTSLLLLLLLLPGIHHRPQIDTADWRAQHKSPAYVNFTHPDAATMTQADLHTKHHSKKRNNFTPHTVGPAVNFTLRS